MNRQTKVDGLRLCFGSRWWASAVGAFVRGCINDGCDMNNVVKVILIILGVIIGAVALYFLVLWLLKVILWVLFGLFVIGSALGIIKG